LIFQEVDEFLRIRVSEMIRIKYFWLKDLRRGGRLTPKPPLRSAAGTFLDIIVSKVEE